MKPILTFSPYLGLIVLLLAPATRTRAAGVPFTEDFSGNPVALGRFIQTVAGTESSFTHNPGTGNLTAILDVDSSPAFYLSEPFPWITETNDLSFSVEFRVTGFDLGAAPTAFLGLFTTNHVDAFGDGLSMVLSVADGLLVANANIDANDQRSAGSTIELDLNVAYRAIGRFHPTRRAFSVAIFGGGDFTNLLQVSTATLSPDRKLALNRIGIQNGGARLTDSSVGSLTVVADEFRIPAQGRPLITVGSARVLEGDSGRTPVVVPVSLSFPTGLPVSVTYATADGTATAAADYLFSGNSVSFAPGEIEKTIQVEVLGDLTNEPEETFAVALTNPVNAIAGPPGTISIANDDGLSGKLDHFVWATIPSPQPLSLPFAALLTAVDTEGRTVSGFNGSVALSSSPLARTQPVGPTTGGVNWNFPLASSAHDARTQILLLASELGGAGTLTALSLNLVTSPRRPLANWVIRLKPTTLAAYSASPSWEGSGWTQVHRGTLASGPTGWVTFPFSTPFEYSGTGNLLLDLSFNTTTGGTDGTAVAWETGRNRSLTFTSNSGNGDPLAWAVRNPAPIVSTRIPQLRFSALRPVRISPTTTPILVGGSWQGELTVLEPVTNLVLTAADELGRSGTSNPFTVGVLGDLAISASGNPTAPRIGQPLTYLLTAANLGLLPATGLVVSDRLPAEVRFVSATGPRGSCTYDGRDVVCDPGTLPPGESASFSVSVTPLNQGTITNRARVTAREPDPEPANNLVTVLTTVAPPILSMENTQITEGDAALTEAVFTVSLSTADREVRVDFATRDNTALASQDFVRTSGSLVFPIGTSSRQIRVPILGDGLPEDTKSFILVLSNPVGAVLPVPTATCTILDNDQAQKPCLATSATSVLEGDSGVTLATFTVTLSRPSGQTVRVDYSTDNRTATAGSDYQTVSGTLFLGAGITEQRVEVPVTGDRLIEPNETFALRLFNPGNATLCNGGTEVVALATVLNDDGLDGRLDHFVWDLIPSPQGTSTPFDVRLSAVDGAGRTVPSFTGPVTLVPSLVPDAYTVGTPGASVNWNFPLAGTAHDARTQVILLASELRGTARLTALDLNVLTSPGRALGNWVIRLKPTFLAAYSASPSWEGSGWTVVYRGSVPAASTEWVTFPFSVPFEYDGTAKLLVDLSFNTAATGRDGICAASDTGRTRSLTFTSNSANGDPLLWTARNPVPAPSTRVPRLRFAGQRPIRISPTTTPAFVAGTWQGSLTVHEPVTRLVVTATDDQARTGLSNPFDVGTLSDLAVGLSHTPELPRIGQRFDYLLTATNLGLLTATGVVLTDRLPPEVRFESAVASTGACTYDGRDVLCQPGDLAPGATASVVVSVTGLTQGIVTNRARATTTLAELNLENNLATLLTTVAPPLLTIEDASITEGNSGTVDLVFNLRLSVVDREVRVEYATADDTAVAGLDYLRTNGVVIFPPGTRTQQLRVPILGDLLPEDAEQFTVQLANPVNAVLFRTSALGVIADDDQELRPCITVANVSLPEGDLGTANAVFTVGLSRVSGQTIRLSYATVAGTATLGSDFQTVSGTLEFPPGSRSQTVSVPILGDRISEPDESFALRFTEPSHATFCDGALEILAQGLLVNDDGLVGKLDHFNWAPIPSPQATNAPIAVTVTAVDADQKTVSSYRESVDLFPSLLTFTNLVGTSAPPVNWRFPLAGSAHDARTQIILLTSDLTGPGRLTALSLNVASTPGRALGNWVIRLKHTSLSAYPGTPSWESTGWTTVARSTVSATASGWVSFEFTTPFECDGVSNLMLDLSFNTSATGPDGQCVAFESGRNRALTFTSNSANGDPLAWSGRSPVPIASTRLPQLRFTLQRPIALTPTRTTPFVDGVWTGQLSVADIARTVVIEANDGKEHLGRSNPFAVGVLGDLAVDLASSPGNPRLGQQLAYRLSVTNLGLANATGVTLTDRLPAEVRFESATGPRGSCTYDGRDVICLPGDVPPGGSAAFDLVVTALAQGSVTNRARVVATEADPFLENNLVLLVSPVAPPLVDIDSLQITEGTGRNVEAVFAVRASASDREIRLNYVTRDGTAVAGQDYVRTEGILVLPAGVRTNVIRVPILGDALREDPESFTVELSTPLNAVLSRGTATAQILDDDTAELPCLSVANVAVTEADSRSVDATFLLRLSKPSGQTISFQFATAERSATAGVDYRSVAGSISLLPGVLETNVVVSVLPDRLVEPDEVFELHLSSAVNVAFCTGPGPDVLAALGTIINDDGLPGRLDSFQWAPIPSPQGIGQDFAVSLSARDAFQQVIPTFTGSVSVRGWTPASEQTAGTTGTPTLWSFPLASAAHDSRLQALYFPIEIGPAGRLRELSLSVTTLPGRTLRHWTIRLKPSALAGFPASPSWDSAGWTTVYQGDLDLTSTGWVSFPFSQPFDYDGNSGLLVDFSFETSITGRDGAVTATDTGRPRSLVATANSTSGDPLAWSARTPPPTVNTRVPVIRFTTQRSVPVVPAETGPFVAGAWQGQVLVRDAATQLSLEADDAQTHTGRSNPFDVGIVGDLAISHAASTLAVRIGQSLTYQLTVTNRGLTPATGVVVTDRLPPEMGFVSAFGPRGACQLLGREVVCNLGVLEPLATASFDVQVAALAQGSVTNRARVTALENDPDLSNNLSLLVATVTPPVLAIQPATLREGDGDPVEAVFVVRLSSSGKEVRVSYATTDGSARANLDYLPTSGTLVFPVGITTNYVRVPILGDTLPEDPESFTVTLSSAFNAELFNASASATIEDDDRPGIAVQPARQPEGDAGRSFLAFQITLFPPPSNPVTVSFTTQDDTARAGSDYESTSGTITFPIGSTTQTVQVPILGDTSHEPDETFRLVLASAVGASIDKASAPGTILNDDLPALAGPDVLVNLAVPGTSNAVVRLTLSYPSLQEIEVDYATADGTATAGTDYTAQAGTLRLPPGTTVATLALPIIPNTFDETNEFFRVRFNRPRHVALPERDVLVTIINTGAVNQPPTIAPVPDLSVLEDSPTRQIALSVFDPETPVPKLVLTAQSSNDLLFDARRLALVDTALSFTPLPDAFGESFITLSVADEAGSTASTRFRLTVQPVNDPPTLDPLPDLALPEDATEQVVSLSGLSVGPPNERGQSLVVAVESDNPALVPQLILEYLPPNATGRLRFAPRPDANGIARITVRVQDDGGTANGGVDTATRSFRVSVTRSSTPPAIRLVQPLDYDTFAPDPNRTPPTVNLALEAAATPGSSPIARVEFYAGSVLLGTTATPPYRIPWQNVGVGDYRLAARAFDTSGLSADSAPVRISVSDLAAEVAIIRNYDDPEIGQVRDHLLEMGLSSRVFDQEGLSFPVLSRYRLILWMGLGRTGEGISDADVAILREAFAANRPLYFIGDHLLTDVAHLSSSGKAAWTDLLHLRSTGKPPVGGRVDVGPFDDDPEATLTQPGIVNGRYGSLADFVDAGPFDTGQLLAEAEGQSIGRVAGGEVYVAFPHRDFADPGRVRSFTQLGRVWRQPDEESALAKKLLFQNVVCWLLECRRCGALDVKVTLEPPAEAAKVGQPVRYRVTAAQSGECEATGITLRGRLPAGASDVRVNSPRGSAVISRNEIVIHLGHLASAEETEFEIEFMPTLPGPMEFCVTISGNNATSDASDTACTTILPEGIAIPHLEVDRSGVDIRLGWTAAAAGWVLESSPVLGPSARWSAVPGTPVPAGNQLWLVVSRSPDPRYFRLRR